MDFITVELILTIYILNWQDMLLHLTVRYCCRWDHVHALQKTKDAALWAVWGWTSCSRTLKHLGHQTISLALLVESQMGHMTLLPCCYSTNSGSPHWKTRQHFCPRLWYLQIYKCWKDSTSAVCKALSKLPSVQVCLKLFKLFKLFSGVGLWRHQPKQSCPDFPFPRRLQASRET